VPPTQGRNLGEEPVGNVDALCAQMLDGKIEIDGDPVNDRVRHEGSDPTPRKLWFSKSGHGSRPQMEKESPAQGIARLALLRPAWLR